ncbi:PQQ-binding-like beta-propeller repeat protein [Micromonospora profundi]|uniref:PQQ-binding-like beta-propeller repeat protein n=1 Tax=Micromonospora profundi TaxID=1420889 RepID=A0AAJ6L5A2_9ACTN|nr:PQQ-binding-like beta-propeller repeat protein [Micromonospora profundi]WLS45553.1 PQQ-binding-like beta-propeller repeat protein [Micromonospora profundi]
MSIIELGEVRDEPASMPPPRRPRAAGRPLRSTGVLLLTLLVLAGGAPVPRRAVTSVPTVPDASAYLTDDGVVVVDPTTPDGERYLTAYTLPSATGEQRVRRRWRVPLARSGDYLAVWAERGLLLAVGANTAEVLETTAFDVATGQRRWHHPGLVQWTVDGGLLLVDDADDAPGTVSRVAPDTGRVLWSVPVPPGSPDYHERDGRVDQVVVVQPTGELQVYDAGTGTLLRSVDTLPGDRSAFQRVQVVGDLVLLVPPGSTRLVAYSLPDIAPMWTSPVPLVAWLVACADLLCAGQQTGGLQAIDATTGGVRWAYPGPDMLADVRQDRMLMMGRDQRYAVRDAKSGQERTDLGQWGLVSRLRRDDDLIGIRSTVDGRLVVAELDLAAGRARTLDILPGVAGGCQAALPVLLCRRLDGSTALWRLHR